MAVMRHVDGFTDIEVGNPLQELRRPDPTRYAMFMEDFLLYDKTQGNAAYTLTATNGVDTIVGPTGVLVLTLGGADNDLAQLYPTDAAWQTQAGKRLFFEARVKVNKGSGGTIGQEELIIGLTGVQTGANLINAGGTARTFDNGMAFISYDATTNIGVSQVLADAESTESAVTTYADDTWMVLSIYYDGGSNTYFYVNDTLEATLTSNLPTAVLTPMLYIKAGAAHAKVLNVDYVMVVTER